MSELNEVIRIYRKSNVQADDGSLSLARTLMHTLYAKVRPMSGSERSASDSTEAYATHRFKVLQRSDLNPDDILVWNSVDYNIKFIADNGPKEIYMYIDAERGGAM